MAMFGSAGVRWWLAGPRARTAALVVAAGALWALGGCNGLSTDGQDEMRSDLARLSSRLKKIESENRKLSEKIRELDDILRRRARASEGSTRVPRGVRDVEVRAPDKPVGIAPVAPEETTGDEFTRKVQNALKRAGQDPGPVDGKKGPLTTEAIKAFQRDNNLPETGMTDEATWALLKRYLPD